MKQGLQGLGVLGGKAQQIVSGMRSQELQGSLL